MEVDGLIAVRIALAGLAVILALCSRYIVGSLRSAWMLRGVPSPPEGSLLGGHVKVMADFKGHRQIQKWTHQFGGFMKLRMYWQHAIIVADPFLYEEMLQHERQGNIDKPEVKKSAFPGQRGERNIFSEQAAHPLWKLLRKGVAPAFNMANLRQYHHHVVSVLDCLISGIQEAGPDAVIDVSDVAQRESFDVIGTVGFGVDFGTRKDITKTATTGFTPDGDVFRVFKGVLSEVFKMNQNPLRQFLLFLPDVKQGREYLGQLAAMSISLLKDVRLRGPPTPEDRSIAAHILRLKDPATNTMLSDARLAAEFLVFFLAGAETTGHTIAWTLYELVKNPKALAKLEAELDKAGLLVTAARPSPRPFTFADIQLPYLQAVVKESMRRRPVAAAGFRRVAVRDVPLSNGITIPRGTLILGSNLASMCDPRYWGADADKFVPERWEDPTVEHVERRRRSSQEGAKSVANGAGPAHDDMDDQYEVSLSGNHDKVRKFHPFGDGLRNCVGQSLARMNIPTAVAVMVANFQFRLIDEVAKKDTYDVETLRGTLQFENGLRMHCKPRAAASAA